MGKVIAKNVITRKAGHLYYVDAHGNVCEAKMARGGRKKKAGTKKRSTSRAKTTKRTASRRRR